MPSKVPSTQGMVERLRALPLRALALWRTPLGKVLAIALVLRLAGFTWGMPASDGWDDDGVAPRDFLVGVMETYWPGHHYTYPPLHLLILTVTTAPVWVAALLRAPSLDPAAVIHAFIGVPTMTGMAVIARAVTVALSLGLLWNLAEIGRLLRGTARAGVWVAIACGLDLVLTYYSQTTNLDVPYLFWSVLALRWLVHAMACRAPTSLRKVALFAALAVATKDQAYALFLLGVPASLAVWLLVDREARPLAMAIGKQLAIGVAIALPVLLLLDGAFTNPSGWSERVHYLLGSASQDFAYYPATPEGRLRAARDALLSFDQFYPWPFAALAVLGLGLAVLQPDRARRAAGFVPILAALSFTVAFDMTARRSEHRFALPQMVLFGVYVGLALDALHERYWTQRAGALPRALVALAAAGLVLGYALFQCVAVDVAMLQDPRYDAEAWMREHVKPDDPIEIYGSNVQLPRFPSDVNGERIDTTPVATRNPILGVKESNARFSDVESRRPRFIVVSALWALRYLIEDAWVAPQGRILSAGQQRLEGDVDSRAYFRDLHDGRLHYRLAHVAKWTSSFWPPVDIHASLTREIWIFERLPDAT
jgi:hypothetical protein